jgi:hypothetical protein
VPRTVVEVLSFDDLPAGGTGSRRAIVRWSDGCVGEAATWFADEILISEGDLLGKSEEAIRSLHFLRDREYLARDDATDGQV